MTQSREKLKRVKPLIRARQAQLNQAAMRLKSIRDLKVSAVADLRQSQQDYIAAVDSINAQRQSSDRSMLLTLESTVDTVKSRFYRTLKKLRDVEAQEAIELQALIEAERNLKTVDKLEERYSAMRRKEADAVEQKVLDELSIQKFHQNKSTT